MKFDRSFKIELCHYGQVNSLRLESSAASKWTSKRMCGYHLFCWRWYIDVIIPHLMILFIDYS